jgi:hypothetical protein
MMKQPAAPHSTGSPLHASSPPQLSVSAARLARTANLPVQESSSSQLTSQLTEAPQSISSEQVPISEQLTLQSPSSGQMI